jgi:hypothetical protein
MRRALVLGLVVLLIAAAGGWYYISGTPQYSLYRMGAAMAARDAEEAEQYIDIERVADRAVDAIYEGRSKPVASEGWGAAMADGFLELLKPVVKARTKTSGWLE